jgi:hypothetical protein
MGEHLEGIHRSPDGCRVVCVAFFAAADKFGVSVQFERVAR